MARSFEIYERSDGTIDAVKLGWSWPGFWFGPFWILARLGIGWGCLVWILGILAVLLTVGFVGTALKLDPQSEGHFALALGALPFATLVGFCGNQFVAWCLRKRGFSKKGQVHAKTVAEAKAEYKRS